MSGLTPAPWIVGSRGDGTRWISRGDPKGKHNQADFAGTDADAMMTCAAPELYAALIAAKQHLWREAQAYWTRADFKRWLVVQQIDAALEKADGNPRTEGR